MTPLDPGSRLGPYEVLRPLGAGGMGEVYLARDSRLERNVAIKALPGTLAGSTERLARFDREAKLLASLNHGNIAAIYGLEEVDGVPHLVLEFVDGETLAERLRRGPIAPRETLDIGRQVAAAMEAAHDKGIIHRDLKPANVMLTPAGQVKVLDFGLARSGGSTTGSTTDLSASPTLAAGATAAGVILGTAPYMSPEQARGLEVDRRTDIWALGCLLFECLAGRGAFNGDTVSDVVARILEREPDWNLIPQTAPPRLADLVRRCLTRDVDSRPRDVGDLRRELDAILLEMTTGSGIRRAPTEMPSLAVLYFENLSTDAESGYFCAGITEDILTDLSKIKGLRVASKNAVLRYRGQPVDIAKVGAELGVRSVLEGSVRRAGDRVRISAQLINVADGFQVWAERYDRKLEDVFQVQEEIASSIAQALRVALTPQEVEALKQDRPNDAQAYDLYLKGRARYAEYSQESLQAALVHFREALAIDPNYALAWAGVADALGQLVAREGVSDSESELRTALDAALRAVALAPRSPEGYKAEALVRLYMNDREGSRAALKKALEIQPRYGPALTNLAVLSFAEGNIAGTERYLRRSCESDPQDAFSASWLSFVLAITGRTRESDAQLDRVRTISDLPMYRTITILGRLLSAVISGDRQQIARAVELGQKEVSEPGAVLIMQALAAGLDGRREEMQRAFEASQRHPVASANLVAAICSAHVALLLGQPERALRILEPKVIGRLASMYIRLYRPLHPLADEPTFAPRRCDAVLVWPLEAPMMSPDVHALFREVHVESGLPERVDSVRVSTS
jgi:serine/threonine protein kinase/Tfp pilus assembly protein PilF